jgi:hypothetical protein
MKVTSREFTNWLRTVELKDRPVNGTFSSVSERVSGL